MRHVGSLKMGDRLAELDSASKNRHSFRAPFRPSVGVSCKLLHGSFHGLRAMKTSAPGPVLTGPYPLAGC